MDRMLRAGMSAPENGFVIGELQKSQHNDSQRQGTPGPDLRCSLLAQRSCVATLAALEKAAPRTPVICLLSAAPLLASA